MELKCKLKILKAEQHRVPKHKSLYNAVASVIIWLSVWLADRDAGKILTILERIYKDRQESQEADDGKSGS